MVTTQKLCDEIRKQLAGKQAKTRFAPSPTGYLHLGHVASAIYVWGIAQVLKADVILRIEDHDQSRYRSEFAEAILEDLHWLGFIPLTPLESLEKSFHIQSACTHFYDEALAKLEPGRLFYCRCSRKDIGAAVARQAIEGDLLNEVPYSGACEHLNLIPGHNPLALRFRMSDRDFPFYDARLGLQSQNPFRQQRASILKDKNNHWSYQMAVVVDDMRDGVNVIIRGEDILTSTGRQLDLRDALGGTEEPVHLHHPLICDDKGAKLSKRFLSEGVRALKIQNVAAEAVLGQAAFAVGLQSSPQPITASKLHRLFS